MTSEDWVILSNFAVTATGILAAATTEHEAIKALRDTTINLIRTIAHVSPKEAKEIQEDESK